MKLPLSIMLLFCLSLAAWAEIKIFTVSPREEARFRTIQEAVASVPDNGTNLTIIHIRPGQYQGPVVVSSRKKNISFIGDDALTTVINWGHNVKDEKPPGADGFNPGAHIRGNDFHAENITFCNSSGDRGQGLAMRLDADRAVFVNCRFLGWQDTLMANSGRHYFTNCTIEGRVDFIFGDGTSVFDGCHIHSRNGGYITAASTPPEKKFGYVFLHCKLTGDTVPWAAQGTAVLPKESKLPNTYLGRPWRPHASTVFIECEMGSHIRPEGWNNWGKTENETTARYAEFGNTGPGTQMDKRTPWIQRLSREEVQKITPESVLSGSDGWNPMKKVK